MAKKKKSQAKKPVPKQNPKQTQKKANPAVIYGVVIAVAVCLIVGCVLMVTGVFAPKGTYADIVIKDYGTITVKLEPEHAPITVANFVKQAESGFYDGLTFHRIIEGFMMQGGSPNGTSSGGTDEKIKGEFIANGVNNELKHTRGAISMARSAQNDSASCQFFIMHEDRSSLDGQYAVFGYVVSGMDVVDKVCKDAKPTDGNGTIPKGDQPIIESITIRKR